MTTDEAIHLHGAMAVFEADHLHRQTIVELIRQQAEKRRRDPVTEDA